jgi:hypothetical protein
VRRLGNEFKHGEKISFHDIESAVYRHVTDAVVRVRAEDKRLRIFLDSASLNPGLLRRIENEVEQSIPEIGAMVEAGLLDRVKVEAVTYEELPRDRRRTKQRLVF